MIGGRPAVEVVETLTGIGFASAKAEMSMEAGASALAVCDANLYDFVKGLPYAEFMLVRDAVTTGHVDAGRSVQAAGKAWEANKPQQLQQQQRQQQQKQRQHYQLQHFKKEIKEIQDHKDHKDQKETLEIPHYKHKRILLPLLD
jgi:hypothetical protein